MGFICRLEAAIGDTYNLNGRGDSIGIVGSTIVLIA